MQIKDIVNRDLVNLTNCDQEPIHIPGSIQPHGFLLAVDSTNATLSFCSANVESYLGVSPQAILGIPAAEVLGNSQLDSVTDSLSNGSKDAGLPLSLEISGRHFFCTVHRSGHSIIIEGEPFTEPAKPAAIYEQTSQFLTYMKETHTLQELCQLVAEGTREITGYDRVMIYRFDEDYNGEVYAESCVPEVEPFLGLHYPHTDIPVQARELYMRNLLRMITDLHYTPVPIFTIDDGTDKNLDLSISVLRSTSPIHVQYLQNMGVDATLTISLIHQGRLWGLIACHHYSSKIISPEVRLAAQLQGHFITSQIDVRQSSEEYAVARKTNSALEKLSATDLVHDRQSLADIVDSPEMLTLCNASATAIIFDGVIYKSAGAPSDDVINFFNQKVPVSERIFETTNINSYFSGHQFSCEETSGMLLHRLSKDNCVMWFRPEYLTEIHWAGDPSKAILKDEKGLSPRNSFALYKETVKCKSKDWIQPEVNSATNYAHLLQTHLNLILLGDEEKRNRRMNHELHDTNSELENINWISTHDLQEPLRKIQLNASKVLTSGDPIPKDIKIALTRMDNSAKRMQTLLIDIMRYTNLRHTETILESADLNAIIGEIISDYQEQIAEINTKISVDDLPVIAGMPFLIRQLFANLIINAIKYARPDVAPLIEIRTMPPQLMPNGTIGDPLYFSISVTDNGTGFEQKYSESIFNIFTRLNSDADYKGSGVGLALCKKIMVAHGGYIMAEGKPDEGARFTCYFPVISTSSRSASSHSL